MGELRASVDGCQVVEKYEEGCEFTFELRTALADLAETTYAERAAQAEVAGFGLKVGDMGLSLDPMAPVTSELGCWGYSTTGGGSCKWFTAEKADPRQPEPCTFYSNRKA